MLVKNLGTENPVVEKWTGDHCPLFHSLYYGDDSDPPA
jgi:hypothetical protein